MALNQNIRNKRYECGMSQRELADAVGISQSMLCQIERGTKLPSLPIGRLIADALGCTIDELLDSSEA